MSDSFIQVVLAEKYGNKKAKLKKVPTQAGVKRIEESYAKEMTKRMAKIKAAILKKVTPKLDGLIKLSLGEGVVVRQDDFADDLEGVRKQLRIIIERELSEAEISKLTSRIATQTDTANRLQFSEQIKTVLSVRPELAGIATKSQIKLFVSENVSLITQVSKDLENKMARLVDETVRQGATNKEFARTIEARFSKELENPIRSVEARSRLIARDQVSKLNGQLTQTRQSALGVKKYTWRAVGDERVRDTHQSKDGQVFSWDKPPADTGHPGNDYQCRCVAEPIIESALE